MKYDARLDGLRGLAVLAVALYHATLLPGGSIGVDVFFVLSGWLITSILWSEADRSGSVDVHAFATRRIRRLAPALMIVLAAYAALSPILWPGWSDFRWIDVGAAALYLTNWREAILATKGPLAHTWSLAIEAQFYAVWPLAIMAAHRLGRKRAALLAFAAWAALTLVRGAVVARGLDELAYFAFPLHATGLLLGSAIALRPPAAFRVQGGAGLALLAAILLIPHNHDTFAWRISLGEAAAAAVILAPPAWLAWRPLAFVGLISYGFYLWHIPVWLAFWRGPLWLAQMLMIPIALALATASYFTAEAFFRKPALTSASAVRAAA